MERGEDRLGEDPEDGAPRGGARRRPGSQARGPMVDSVTQGERETVERDFTEDREITDAERLELFRSSMQQSVLPDLPPMPGYHSFWATTNNPRDTVSQRMRLGYRPVLIAETPGWEGIGVTAGNVAGVVSVNEMIAMRVPERLYQDYMREVHHIAPLAEEEKLKAVTEQMREELDMRGARVVEIGDGTASVVQRARPPIFPT